MKKNLGVLRKIPYKPFQNVNGFSLCIDNKNIVHLVDFSCPEADKHYVLEIEEGSMSPRDALLMTNFIGEFVQAKKVLDIGTGSGILAIHSAVFGASRVVGVDIDQLALESAMNNGLINGLRNIQWVVSDLFSNIGNDRFDLILSNPPQLPMKSGLVQDTGGTDGRMLVKKIISESPNYLKPNGVLLMILFDFLGVDTTYGNNPPLKELFIKNGFQLDIIKREKAAIRKGGQTEKSTANILEQYPRYKFETHGDEIIHEKLLVKAQIVCHT